MEFPRALPRLLAGGLAALALSTALFTVGPAPEAQAQDNYRVCGVWNSAGSPGQIGSGLVTKVYKGGADTCQQKLGFMISYYGSAWRGSDARDSFYMISCEDFAKRLGSGGDPCYGLKTNAIYKYTSPSDKLHPVRTPAFSWWHA
jgi:hypothetical protein